MKLAVISFPWWKVLMHLLRSTCRVYFVTSLARTIAVCFKIESYSNYRHQKEFCTYIFCNWFKEHEVLISTKHFCAIFVQLGGWRV